MVHPLFQDTLIDEKEAIKILGRSSEFAVFIDTRCYNRKKSRV